MPFPKNLDQLRAAGYRFHFGTKCKFCLAQIEFWTTPNQKSIPLDIDGRGNVIPHFDTCKTYSERRRTAAQRA